MSYYVSVSVPAAHKSFELNVSSISDLRRKIAEKLFWINSNEFSNPLSTSRKCIIVVLVQNAYVSLNPSSNANSLTMFITPVVPHCMYMSSEGECFETWWNAFKNFIKRHKTFKKVYHSNTVNKHSNTLNTNHSNNKEATK